MNGIKIKFWEGRTPPVEYFAPINRYEDLPMSGLRLGALTKYSKQTGKKISEMTYDEVLPFITSNTSK